MNIKTVTFYYILCVYLLIFRVVSAETCGQNGIDVENRIQRGVALVGAVFWKGKIKDLTQCATACIRRKVCRSFNFDMFAGWCELNFAVKEDYPFRHGTNGLMYSDIEGWLAEFDPACAFRPCTINQVCVPGVLGINGGTDEDCSYICMNSALLCPKPYNGFSGDRKVGDIASKTCGTGEVGDIAECLITQKWNQTLNCLPLYGSTCSAEDDCLEIDGVCTDSTCQCTPGTEYKSSDKRCTLVCTSPPSYDNAVTGNVTGPQRTFTCEAKYRPTGPQVVECVVDDTGMASWSPDNEICTELYEYECTDEEDCSEIKGTCDNKVCTCALHEYYDEVLKECLSPQYNSSCTDDTDCQNIDWVCTAGTCQCPSGMKYESNENVCNLTCLSPPSYDNAVMGSGTGPQRLFTCEANYRPTVSQVECVVNDTDTPSWSPTGDICTELEECYDDANCSQFDGTCKDNKCICALNHIFDVEANKCMPQFKLLPGERGGDGIKTGLLYMNDGKKWRNVCRDGWKWTATRAICQDINPNFTFGGSFHHREVYGSGNSSIRPIKLNKLDCGSDGRATSFADCKVDGYSFDCSHDYDLGLTCYKHDITGDIRLTRDYGKGPKKQLRLEVMYNGTWGTVCNGGWNKAAANVACRSINTDKPNMRTYCINSCAGGDGPYKINDIHCNTRKNKEPHLFYCRNGGWNTNYSCKGNEVGLVCKK